MLRKIFLLLFLILLLTLIITTNSYFFTKKEIPEQSKNYYWFILHRKSNKEELYRGLPGERLKSELIKTFQVKTGIPGERPTPLPQLIGKKYWLIIKKERSENPETAPYFLTLNIPVPDKEPFGPSPYIECKSSSGKTEQCNWVLPGAFGLHGINGDSSRLSKENPGSSGCIRHSDKDITYLFSKLDPKQEIRYYIEDN